MTIGLPGAAVPLFSEDNVVVVVVDKVVGIVVVVNVGKCPELDFKKITVDFVEVGSTNAPSLKDLFSLSNAVHLIFVAFIQVEIL